MLGMVVIRMSLPGDLRCHIRPKEGTPAHEPHAHIFSRDKTRSLEIDLMTLKVSEIRGRWGSRSISNAVRWVESNQERLKGLYDEYQEDQEQ